MSVTGPEDADRIRMLGGIPVAHRLVSAEPYLKEIPDLRIWLVTFLIDWLIIGGQTGPKVIPPFPWINAAYKKARMAGVPVWIKKNAGLDRLEIKRWPTEMAEALREGR